MPCSFSTGDYNITSGVADTPLAISGVVHGKLPTGFFLIAECLWR
jgi:hypothetical protein